MAGPHQIWQLDLEKNEVSTFAGSGREARLDGTLLEAGFAQPSGITTDGKNLYVSDAESNIIRALDPSKGEVQTLVGGDLFEFGDVDGIGDDVRLQHPLGLLWLRNKLLIADTYNHKIKELDPQTRSVKTLFGTGKPGQSAGKSPSFYEPGGLSAANDNLYVADTNNHAIRVIDLKTKQTSTLRINGLTPPAKSMETSAADSGPNSEAINVPSQRLRTSSNGFLTINVDLPDGYHLNPAAPQRYKVSVDKESSIKIDSSLAARVSKDLKLPLRIPLSVLQSGEANIRAQVTLYYCREDNTGTCRIKTLVWQAPIEISDAADAPAEVKLNGKLTAE